MSVEIQSFVDSLAKELPVIIAKNEGMERARTTSRTGSDGLSAFWKSQGAVLSQNPTEEIIGEYVGTAYWTDFRNDHKLEGLRIVFRKNGVFETNLALLTNTEAMPRRGAPELRKGLVQGRYRVLGPTQLVLGSGDGVSTYGFSLDDGRLSFYHRRLEAFFSLGTSAAKAPAFRGKDVAGVYKGLAFIAEEGSSEIKKVDGVEIVFTDNGYFTTNFGSRYGKLLQGFTSYDGTYLIDKYGKLVCFAKLHGGDFFGGDAASFFDWNLKEGLLRVNHFQGAHYGCALVLSPTAGAVKLQNEEALEELTSGTYIGSAFRSTPGGQIVEVPGIELRFSKDGVYSGLPARSLKPGRQYYPGSDGPFVILSDRQLYMANKWQDGRLTNQGICDVLVSGDKLYFTSLEREAYFALKKR